MKRVFCTLFAILLSGQVLASIQLQVCDPNSLNPIALPEIVVSFDPNTSNPILLPEVMVGTNISILIHSDANDLWSGGLFIEGQDRAFGRLTARPKDPNSPYWAGSCLEAAGRDSYIMEWKDSSIWGFDCYTDDFIRSPGNWFVLDYTAIKPGHCDIGFYDHSESDWTIPDPNLSVYFHNTPTRDFNADKLVNYTDFAIFANHWNTPSDPNDPNEINPADLSRNGIVGIEDVIMFGNYWLWGSENWSPAEQNQKPKSPEEPNIVCDVLYSLVCDPNSWPFTDPNSVSDANSISEITLEIGDSVMIYIDKSSLYEPVQVFDMEVTISDPNLGWIDNTTFGTAEILAYPRMEYFDMIGPGYEQLEGIAFFAANLGPMWDGDMACFIYTPTETGTVTLNMINYSESPAAKLKPIVIHQVLPVVEILEQTYAESPDLQESVSQQEWDDFVERVKESTQK